MNKFWPLSAVLIMLGISMLHGAPPDASAEASPAMEASYLPSKPGIPPNMLDLMNASRAKYLEGSDLIKLGESNKAQEAFNRAVELILQSNWDLPSTPILNQYFQDLIQRIQEDESSYLLAPFETDEEVESAEIDELQSLDLVPSSLDSEMRNALAADLAKTKYEIPITINEMVLKSLDFWMNRNRKVFEAGLVRSGQYRPMIERVFREESIPLDLMYLAQVESLFRPQALSRAKAKGIWQFGKGTAVRYGLKVSRDVDERSDPEKSTRAAARYLNDLYQMFKDWNLVLAAYNWGEGKVQRLINSTGMNDFWQLVDLRRRLPEETKNHVPLIQASVILGRNPEKYGFTTQLDPPLQYTEISVSKPIDLRAAAKVLSTSIDELKKLNPSLRGMTTPANYPNFQLKVPIDSAPELHEKLASLPTAKIRISSESGCQHKVKAGETLSGIAKKYGVSIDRIRKANGLSTKSPLKAGVKLNMPSCSKNDSVEIASKSSKTVTRAAKIRHKSSAGKRAKAAKSNVGTKKQVKIAKTKRSASPRIVAAASSKAKLRLKTSTEQIASK